MTGRHRAWAVAAAVLGFATLAAYVAVIVGEGDNDLAPVVGFGAAIAAGSGGALFAALTTSATAAAWSLRLAIVLLGAIGVLGIFSIGVPLLVAATLATVGFSRMRPP